MHLDLPSDSRFILIILIIQNIQNRTVWEQLSWSGMRWAGWFLNVQQTSSEVSASKYCGDLYSQFLSLPESFSLQNLLDSWILIKENPLFVFITFQGQCIKVNHSVSKRIEWEAYFMDYLLSRLDNLLTDWCLLSHVSAAGTDLDVIWRLISPSLKSLQELGQLFMQLQLQKCLCRSRNESQNYKMLDQSKTKFPFWNRGLKN